HSVSTAATSLTVSSVSMLHFSTALLLAAACLVVSTAAHKATTCGNHVHRLSCETGVILVQESLYGRADTQTCAGGKAESEVTNTECSLQGADDIIKTRCNGKKVCEVTPAIFTTDPCSETFKYLETSYSCVPATHLITCEHSLAHLKCDDGQVIHVYQADFGRRDPNICSFRRDNQRLQNVKCSLPTDKVAERCNGRNSCSMRAAPSVFGDSCPNTYKYLELTYTCRSP
ncbi:L-rhamnose-binding lectin SML-like, partial [Pelmatolapia mariae]|uniref:L-rhamnose-binding lectin SML-like n=1 Tax=Pelmatolapia mariae TaxID=158779 RepID=UPI002FE58607